MIIFYEKIRNQLLDQSCENTAGPLGGKNDGTDPKWLEKSLELTEQARQLFGTAEGLYYLTPANGENLLTRCIA
jgi:uncharacterized protein YyaL (SSP411 family)